jgi:hypothetical protein
MLCCSIWSSYYYIFLFHLEFHVFQYVFYSAKYRVSIKSIPDNKHLLQENYVE